MDNQKAMKRNVLERIFFFCLLMFFSLTFFMSQDASPTQIQYKRIFPTVSIQSQCELIDKDAPIRLIIIIIIIDITPFIEKTINS